MSIYELDKMKLAAEMVGVNFHSIAGEMDSLNKKFRDIPLGDWDSATATALAQLKQYSGMAVGYEDLKDLSPEERLRRLLQAARSMSDKGLAGDLLGKIMGAGSRELFIAMDTASWSVWVEAVHWMEGRPIWRSVTSVMRAVWSIMGFD